MSAPEDRNLATEQYPDLNRQFYAARLAPHDYLMHRYRGLFLTAQSPERLPDGFDTQLSVGDVHATWPRPEDWDELELRDYVSTESTVLLHHTSEALFRLYLAHAESPECPWLAVARLRIPRHFKERVEAFLQSRRDPEVHGSLTFVFYGRREAPDGGDERWEDAKNGLVQLMSQLGQRLLDEGPLYNSAKHGLSLLPGAASMAFGDQSGPMAVHAEGPSITHLTVAKGEHGKRWFQETVWLNPDRNLALIGLALHQVSNLWAVAKHRYTDEPWDSTNLRMVTTAAMEAVRNHPPSDKRVTITVPSMRMDLLYYKTENDI